MDPPQPLPPQENRPDQPPKPPKPPEQRDTNQPSTSEPVIRANNVRMPRYIPPRPDLLPGGVPRLLGEFLEDSRFNIDINVNSSLYKALLGHNIFAMGSFIDVCILKQQIKINKKKAKEWLLQNGYPIMSGSNRLSTSGSTNLGQSSQVNPPLQQENTSQSSSDANESSTEGLTNPADDLRVNPPLELQHDNISRNSTDRNTSSSGSPVAQSPQHDQDLPADDRQPTSTPKVNPPTTGKIQLNTPFTDIPVPRFLSFMEEHVPTVPSDVVIELIKGSATNRATNSNSPGNLLSPPATTDLVTQSNTLAKTAETSSSSTEEQAQLAQGSNSSQPPPTQASSDGLTTVASTPVELNAASRVITSAEQVSGSHDSRIKRQKLKTQADSSLPLCTPPLFTPTHPNLLRISSSQPTKNREPNNFEQASTPLPPGSSSLVVPSPLSQTSNSHSTMTNSQSAGSSLPLHSSFKRCPPPPLIKYNRKVFKIRKPNISEQPRSSALSCPASLSSPPPLLVTYSCDVPQSNKKARKDDDFKEEKDHAQFFSKEQLENLAKNLRDIMQKPKTTIPIQTQVSRKRTLPEFDEIWEEDPNVPSSSTGPVTFRIRRVPRVNQAVPNNERIVQIPIAVKTKPAPPTARLEEDSTTFENMSMTEKEAMLARIQSSVDAVAHQYSRPEVNESNSELSKPETVGTTGNPNSEERSQTQNPVDSETHQPPALTGEKKKRKRKEDPKSVENSGTLDCGQSSDIPNPVDTEVHRPIARAVEKTKRRKAPKTIATPAIPDSGKSSSAQSPVNTESPEPSARVGEKRKLTEEPIPEKIKRGPGRPRKEKSVVTVKPKSKKDRVSKYRDWNARGSIRNNAGNYLADDAPLPDFVLNPHDLELVPPSFSDEDEETIAVIQSYTEEVLNDYFDGRSLLVLDDCERRELIGHLRPYVRTLLFSTYSEETPLNILEQQRINNILNYYLQRGLHSKPSEQESRPRDSDRYAFRQNVEPITKYNSSMLERKRPPQAQPESSSRNLSSCSKNDIVVSSSEPLLLESIVDGEDGQNDGVEETTASERAPVDTEDHTGDVDEKPAGEGEGIDIENEIQKLLIDAWAKLPNPEEYRRKPYVADDQKTAKANFMKWFNLESRRSINRGGENNHCHGPGRIEEIRKYFGVLPADDIPNEWPNFAIEQEKEPVPAGKNQSEAMNKELAEERKEDQEEASGNDPDHDRMDNTGNDPKIAQAHGQNPRREEQRETSMLSRMLALAGVQERLDDEVIPRNPEVKENNQNEIVQVHEQQNMEQVAIGDGQEDDVAEDKEDVPDIDQQLNGVQADVRNGQPPMDNQHPRDEIQEDMVAEEPEFNDNSIVGMENSFFGDLDSMITSPEENPDEMHPDNKKDHTLLTEEREFDDEHRERLEEELILRNPELQEYDHKKSNPEVEEANQDEIIEAHEQQDMDTGDDEGEDDMQQDVVDDHEEDVPDEDQQLNEEPVSNWNDVPVLPEEEREPGQHFDMVGHELCRNHVKVELAIVAAPAKRKRGRPPGKKKKKPVKEVDPDAPKRGRGRPPNPPIPLNLNESPATESDDEPRRPRGRPKGSTKKKRNTKVKVQAHNAPGIVNAQIENPEEENASDAQQALPNDDQD